jgi:NADPH-dependent glutamate synthase beta subunit-like oxidoreductase
LWSQKYMSRLQLAHSLQFADLYDRTGLVTIDQAFLAALTDPQRTELLAARQDPAALDNKAESALIASLAAPLEGFIAKLFNIESAVAELNADIHAQADLFSVKRLFVQRVAVKAFKADEAVAFDAVALREALNKLLPANWSELDFAKAVTAWQQDDTANAEALDTATRYAAWAVHTHAHPSGVLFQVPHKPDPVAYIPLEQISRGAVAQQRMAPEHWRDRDGFGLTDHGMNRTQALDQMNYCIWCHEQGKDSCSHGLVDKKTTQFAKSPLGITLAGCPLEEKISEMQQAKAQGHSLAALSIITIDNPMAAATGHRICNDCMKSCIYQKQAPVDIPQSETSILKDVLALPWGFEIYSLLTRWNPLNIRRPLPLPESGYKVLVVGMGPAGFTLAHHLMNDGHTVVGIDGLKIEPLPESLGGVALNGERLAFEPVEDVNTLLEDLDERLLAGFGGVAEYGITVRWNKNYLKLIRLLLQRRSQFALFGGVRFGGTLTPQQAFDLGFDHVALAMGAGRPTVIDMKNGFARGVRQASDFLMALQLTGAAQKKSLANLQIRLPIAVIGGGLTAVDTATESLTYYARQVEKFTEQLGATSISPELAKQLRWNEEETLIAQEFLAHGLAIKAEKNAAKAAGREAKIRALLDSWGGATLVYRRRLIDAPSYTLNHEEVAKGFEEGIRFADNLSPSEVSLDRFGHAEALVCKQGDGSIAIPAKSILVAAGTQPNTVLAREFPNQFSLDGKYFAAIDAAGQPVKPATGHAKPVDANVLLATHLDTHKAMSFFGDLHPSFFGNVVKAMGSAKRGYPVVSAELTKHAASAISGQELISQLNRDLRATVHSVTRLTPTIVEIVVHAPAAARAFKPGQFYRLQNFASLNSLEMEGLAMTGAWTNPELGLVSVIALEMGGSSNLCAALKTGEPVVLMGPTGEPTHLPDYKASGAVVTLVGGGLGNAVLFSIGAALRTLGTQVLYFAGYKARQDRYKIEQIEAAADVVVWCCDEAPAFAPSSHRPQDRKLCR